MKNQVLIFCFLFISCQSESIDCERKDSPYSYLETKFDDTSYDNVNNDNLEIICRVWGYVKYHHPLLLDSIAVNPDLQLLELIKRASNKKKRKRNKILTQWVDSLGEFEYAPQLYRTLLDSIEYIVISEASWINDKQRLGRKLSYKLQLLRYAKRGQNINLHTYGHDNRVIERFDTGVHLHRADVDWGYRLMSLFRFWNIIEYYYPYKDIIDKDWDMVLTEYIPKFINAKKENYYKVVAELIAEINDTHAFYQPRSVFGDKFIPLKFKFVGGGMIVNEVLNTEKQYQKLKIGDRILSIDDKTPCEIKDLVKQYTSCSNRVSLLRRTAEYASLTNKNPVKISFQRGVEEIEIILPTGTKNSSFHNEVYKTLNDSVGYLYPAELQEWSKINKIKQKMHEAKVLIVDHRCYPQFSSQILFDFFLPQRTHISNMTLPILNLPGYFTYCTEIHGEDNPNAFKGKIVVLVNEQTQSMGEYITMALQTLSGTFVIGSQTAGADGNIAWVLLPGNIKFPISGLGVYYPDNTPTQRIGIKIDHYVEPTIGGIRDGRDEVLEKALEIIESEL